MAVKRHPVQQVTVALSSCGSSLPNSQPKTPEGVVERWCWWWRAKLWGSLACYSQGSNSQQKWHSPLTESCDASTTSALCAEKSIDQQRKLPYSREASEFAVYSSNLVALHCHLDDITHTHMHTHAHTCTPLTHMHSHIRTHAPCLSPLMYSSTACFTAEGSGWHDVWPCNARAADWRTDAKLSVLAHIHVLIICIEACVLSAKSLILYMKMTTVP